MSVDILDLPLWPTEEEQLQPNSSKYDLFIPQINIDPGMEEGSQTFPVNTEPVSLEDNPGEQIQIDTTY